VPLLHARTDHRVCLCVGPCTRAAKLAPPPPPPPPTVHAYLPAEASFGFADELRRRSSGAATASLLLSHWERVGVDPFFVPTTEEEREEWGEEGQVRAHARAHTHVHARASAKDCVYVRGPDPCVAALVEEPVFEPA
jgi:hypothetical protein